MATASCIRTSLRSTFILSGLDVDMLAGVAKKLSSSMASTAQLLVGLLVAGGRTATEEGPKLALAEMFVCTTRTRRSATGSVS
jgi:hypothetical protein